MARCVARGYKACVVLVRSYFPAASHTVRVPDTRLLPSQCPLVFQRATASKMADRAPAGGQKKKDTGAPPQQNPKQGGEQAPPKGKEPAGGKPGQQKGGKK